ncbi:MAG: phage replisome organizer N-terminal domain-containing protein [Clostridia bacterium]|nr:phage replisome organizer N-terminal domain-containing protein [Clostridia bacterium]
MAESKKYYWLKLRRDFFKRHDIRIVEALPNGKDYILFYLKLLLESIDHEGTLRFSDTIPYNEQMLSVVTDTNIDVVRSAMKLFIELNMMQVFDDQTIYMTEVDKLIGSECSSARRVREHRKNKRLLQCNDDVTKSNTEIELEKEKEKEIDKETESEVDVGEQDSPITADNGIKSLRGTLGRGLVMLTDEQFEDLANKLSYEELNTYIPKMADMVEKGYKFNCGHYNMILRMVMEDRTVR